MSRVGKQPINLPKGVSVMQNNGRVTVKGPKGELHHHMHRLVNVVEESGVLTIATKDDSSDANMQSGTARALLNNMVLGVSVGFEKKLTLVGVGYRAKTQGRQVELSVGYSHPVKYTLPEGVTVDCPTQTEIVVRGADKQVVGQVASDLRAYRAPEPYKGKGVRYANEQISLKETKKK